MKKRFALYGTGKSGEYCFHLINKIENIEISDVYDGNSEKWGQRFHSYIIKEPSELRKDSYEKILIASNFYNEIESYLIEIGIDVFNLLEQADSFLEQEFYQQQYENYYEGRKSKLGSVLKKNEKLVIYTAIFGGYDELKEPEFLSDNIDYICYTDDKNLRSKHWKIILQDRKFTDPVRCAKEYKILPHKFLSEYKNSIWIDASWKMFGDMREFFEKECGNTGITFSIHPTRNCIYEEADICITKKNDDCITMQNQINRYKEEGYPLRNGLIAGGVIVRKHMQDHVIKLMEEWWKEIDSGSRRDQLSFNYVSWKNLIPYDVLSMSIFRKLGHPYFLYCGHKKIK